jgi:hypothetical protein
VWWILCWNGAFFYGKLAAPKVAWSNEIEISGHFVLYLYFSFCICFSFLKARYISINTSGFIKFCLYSNIIILTLYIFNINNMMPFIVLSNLTGSASWLGAYRGFNASAWCDQSELFIWIILAFLPHKLWISDLFFLL